MTIGERTEKGLLQGRIGQTPHPSTSEKSKSTGQQERMKVEIRKLDQRK
jgi:hypothetical protein